MLPTAHTIAGVGMSDKNWRRSHNIGEYLAANDYRCSQSDGFFAGRFQSCRQHIAATSFQAGILVQDGKG
jgi:hypothetical protein